MFRITLKFIKKNNKETCIGSLQKVIDHIYEQKSERGSYIFRSMKLRTTTEGSWPMFWLV